MVTKKQLAIAFAMNTKRVKSYSFPISVCIHFSFIVVLLLITEKDINTRKQVCSYCYLYQLLM